MGTDYNGENAHTAHIFNKLFRQKSYSKRTGNQIAHRRIPMFNSLFAREKFIQLILVAFGILFIMPTLILAESSATLEWDPNNPTPEGYRLFQREEGQNYDYTQWVYEGEQTTCTVNGLDEGVTYYFVVRAFSGEDQSGDSNEIHFETHTLDSDGDGVGDDADAFPSDSSEWVDTDGDGIGNNADNDDDNDGVGDDADAFPSDPCEWVDTDGDGIGNNADNDDDNDGVGDDADAFPLDPSEWVDTDGDGIGNNADNDDDNDGITDDDETDPNQPIIIDDGDAGTSFTGTWSVSSGANPYGTQSMSSDNPGEIYTYQTNLTGQYVLSVWWTQFANRCADVSIEVYDGNTLIETVIANQLQNGGQWNYLGIYEFSGTARVVVVSTGDSCTTSADAVQFVLNTSDQDSDSGLDDENQPPTQPFITFPADGDNAVALSPRLQSSDFDDPDQNDSHSKSQWRIQTAGDDLTVFDILSAGRLTNIKVPPHILDPGTGYIAQVRYYDSRDLPSEWSLPVTFTTETDKNDKNKNRIPDTQEVTDVTDLNRDGTPDSDQAETLTLFKTYNDNNVIGLSIEPGDTVTSIETAANIDPATLDTTSQPEEEMPYGMVSYKINVTEEGNTASVKILFSDPIDPQTQWVHYDSAMGWQDCSDQVEMDAQGYSADRNLIDGGQGDLDGIANGIIVDIIAPQQTSDSELSLGDDNNSASSGVGHSSCFIRSLF